MSAWPGLLGSVPPFPTVLFVCAHSAAPAQIAAALLAYHSGGRVPVRAAVPTTPGALPPAPVLDELGLDLTAHPAEPLVRAMAHPADFAVTLHADDTCIINPAGTHLAWQTADLTAATTDQARRIRDDIDINVQLLPAKLLLDSL
ncbi:hypothetical protein ACQP1W_28180 [Spirillospora sp. CA-255316]